MLIILLAYIFFRILVAYILPFIVRWYVNRSSDKYFRDNPQYAEMNIANLGQGGLGMTDRDYYFLNDPRSIEIRTAYENMIKTLFGLAGYDSQQASEAQKTVMAIETRLAKASMDRVTRRDPHATYHIKSVAQLSRIAPSFQWPLYFIALGINIEVLNVAQPVFC